MPFNLAQLPDIPCLLRAIAQPASESQAGLTCHARVRQIAVAHGLVALARQRHERLSEVTSPEVRIAHLAKLVECSRPIAELEIHIGKLPVDADRVPRVVDR